MKIVFLTNNNHPGTLGGIQTFNRILSRFFLENLVTITNKNNQKKIYQINNITEIGSNNIIYRIINKLSRRKLEYFLKRKNIAKINPDICILSSPIELNIVRGLKCKKILVQHINYSNYIQSKSYYKNNKKLIELSKKDLDYFVFLSDNDMIKFQKELGFPVEKSLVIRHSAEIDIFNGIKKKNTNLIMVGRISNEHKRYDLAILAMKKLKEFTLLIYGDGPDLESLKELVSKERINNVIFKGPTNDVANALDEASIFIMTSDYEGYPISTIEAINRGLPIIMRDTFEAASDIVDDNKNGVLLTKEWNEEEFISSVREIYSNYEEYAKGVEKAMKKYSANQIKKEWINLFTS